MVFQDCSVRAVIVFVIMFIASCGGTGGDNTVSNAPNTSTTTTSLPSSIQEILEAATSKDIDGIFLYIEQPGKLDESYAAGIQDNSMQLPANANSLFKIASISKLFIAVSASKMVVEGVISLDDTLAHWLPELADRIENSESITISQLIQHRSGIVDFDSQSGFSWQNPHTDIDNTLLFALDKPADFLPNSKYEYSNTNYLLLAKILDKALGYSHQVYIVEHIIMPLGMADTYLELSDIDPSLLVKGYWGNVERSMQDYVIPGGSMISTVKDVATFIRALNTGTLLSAEERNIYASVYWFNHSGWLPGYQSIANYHSDIDAVVIQFINTTGGSSENIASSTNSDIVSFLRQ